MGVGRPLRVDHVAFPVRDAGASLRFYRDILKLPLVRAESGDDWGGRPWLMMIFALGEGRQLALTALRGADGPTGDPESYPRDVRHLGFSANDLDELAAWRRWLEENDVPVSEEDHGGQRSLYFSDPSGAVLEITAPPSDGDVTMDTRAATLVDAWTKGR